MREILFRGKRMDNGEWVEGDICHHDGVVSYIGQHPADGSMVCYDLDPSTVGQFTGLRDKNGKRIFEGDVVLKRTYHGKKAFPVEFGGGMFYCGFGGGSSTATHRYTLEDKQIEIIGNIHDNPELLEVTPDE